ncbi:MAG: HRDC domain-containing protein [Sedimentisphaerales bacterium]|nr:HRDC domain-containing protein [Sedimentisphaerales bacterium]
MRLRIVTLTFDERLGGFPEEALRRAVAGAEVLDVAEYFHEYGGMPRLTLVLRLGDQETARNLRDKTGADPYRTLPDERKGLFVELRRWRNERAEADGVPPFVILRNELLAEICRRAPHTVAGLREIPGIGEKTCARYGSAILALIPEGLPALPDGEHKAS